MNQNTSLVEVQDYSIYGQIDVIIVIDDQGMWLIKIQSIVTEWKTTKSFDKRGLMFY